MRDKLQTLQVKQFKGVDRLIEGTAQDPDVFEYLKNMHIPNPGELKANNGVTKLPEIVGIDEIVHTKFVDTGSEKGIVILGKAKRTGTFQTPTGFVMFRNGAAVTSYDVYVVYNFSGGGEKASKQTLSADSSGITITVPTSPTANIPASNVRSIDFYIGAAGASSGTLAWGGSMYRKSDGLFPADIVIYPPLAGAAGISIPFSPGSFSAQPGTGGGLQADRVYYFGIASWFTFVSTGEVNVSTYTQSNSTSPVIMSAYLPAGKSKLTYVFDYCPYDGIVDGSGSAITSDFSMPRVQVFAGVTPEDLTPVTYDEGVCTTVSKSQTTTAASTDGSGNVTFTSGIVIPVGALLKCTVVGASGLTLNQYYYVKTSTKTSSGCIVTLSTTPSGAAVGTTAAGTPTFGWSTVIGNLKYISHSQTHIPYMGQFKSTGFGEIEWPAVAGTGRYYAVVDRAYRGTDPVSYNSVYDPTTYSQIHGIFYPNENLNISERRDLFWNKKSRRVDLGIYNSVKNPANTNDYAYILPYDGTYEWNSRQYGNRLWLVNGFTEPLYTNTYVMKMAVPSPAGSNTAARWPITKYIEFFKNMMVLGSDTGNDSYQQGYIYYSNSVDIQDFNYNGTTIRAIPINTGDQSKLVGLNVYAQDLSTVGAASFLVAGKQQVIFVWDGTSAAANQISKATGFAGPNCYSLTKFGPIFVGSDNVYLFRSSQDIIPIGDPIKDIIQDLTQAELYNVNVVFHDQQLKIGYTDTAAIDRELWLYLRPFQGGLNRHWSGPHEMKEYSGQTIAPVFGSEKNYRMSFYGGNLYRRDDPGSYSNDGNDISRAIKFRNLGLQFDHFLKLIPMIQFHIRTVEDEDFDITLESEDGSQSIVVNTTVANSDGAKQLKQVQIRDRWLARVAKVTFENTSNSDMSIYDLSLLFSQIRRRLLP